MAFDQGAKWFVSRLPEGSVIPWILDLRYAINQGGFLGWGGHLPPLARRPVLVAMGMVALALLAWLYLRLEADQRTLSMGLAFVISGAASNLLDRFVSGHVVDMFRLHWEGTWHGTPFNVADVYIAVGISVVAWEAFQDSRRLREKA